MQAQSTKQSDGGSSNEPIQISTKRLAQMRQEIDLIDNDLALLLLQRLEIVSAIGSLKQDLQLAIRDPNRESAVLEKVATRVSHSPLAKHVVKLYLSIVDESCEIQDSQAL